MSFLSSACLLPKKRLEHDFKVVLGSVLVDELSQLRQQRQRQYQDLLSDYLNPLLPRTGRAPNQLPDKLPLYWQQLVLPNARICSELILSSFGQVTYLHYLSMLPEDFGLFSPLWPSQMFAYINSLIGDTLSAVTALSLSQHNCAIVCTLTNPNLAAIFTSHGFRPCPSGPQIQGLPLPARFYRPLTTRQRADQTISKLQMADPGHLRPERPNSN
ncbi:hypothetical protein ACFO3I_14335 [Rheinheimera marina]|uniref:Acyl-homoserine-lactone synthase n=1 Tax=Rheinheimera marina TaxID=1774958 RepID=A0ABV9JPK6_9GAMM